ncbi:MAG TPA: hypothetical protein VFY59_01595 [Rubrobacter sp.]|nr:hypothetical protein [Rubrobacter sp.]
MVDLIVLACVVFAFAIVSRRLEGTIITAPIVFVLAGVLLGSSGLDVVEAPRLTGRDEIMMVVASTVLLSVLLHGVTAAPLSAAYARRVQRMAHDAPEKQETLEASRRRESTLTQAPSA